MNRLRLIAAGSALVAAAAAVFTVTLATPRRAAACGGCFAPPETVTAVGSHRMVVSLSAGRTTLWDQIAYSGAPEDFVWVLPVPDPSADIALAAASFFDELESQTAPVVQSPPIPPPDCPPPPFGSPVSEGSDSDGGGRSDEDPVTVFHEEVVGPYETVTIGADSASALYDWLVGHGYGVPASTLPVIEHYVNQGSAFVALRLAPEQGVDAMQPIRVRYPGYMATFPLKMVTVGAVGTIDLSLWVISDLRFESRNYANLTIAPTELTWNWDTNSSNYRDVFRRAIDERGAGRAWVTEFAQPLEYLYFSTVEDVEVARVGLPFPFVTRLRTSVLVDHLDEDLELRPAADASAVWNWLQAENSTGTVPVQSCPDWDGDGRPDTWGGTVPAQDFVRGCAVRSLGGAGALGGATFAAALLAVALLLVRARRRRD